MLSFSQRLTLSDRTIEFGRREVLVGRERHRLSPLEAAALAYLAERPHQPISREELLREVWGYAPQVRSRAADITISRLRQRIESDPRRPRHLLTVRGVGYRFVPTDQASPSSPPAATAAPQGGQPPRPLSEMLGREAELAALTGTSARLQVVQGPAGIGKTRLVLAHAAALSEAGAVVWWCVLSEVRTTEGFEEALAQALGVPLSEDDDAAEQIGHALAGRGTGWLILDTFEHLPAGCAEQLARWLQQAPELRAVVTSRRRLGVPGEQLVRLAPLSAPVAAQLFRARARQVGVDGISRDEAERIAAALDGLPLAIELAAARSPLFSPAQLLARLDEPLSLLRRSRSLDPRHASLEVALAWSWDLLGAAEQAALAQVTVFRGGFTAAAAEAVLDLPDGAAPLEVLSALVDHSLVSARLDTAPRRFTLSTAVRQLAAAKLPDRTHTAARHAAHFADWAWGELQRAETDGLTQALPRLRAERENLLAVRSATEDPTAAARVTLALLEVPPSRQPTAAAHALLSAAVDLEPLSPALAGRLRAHRAALHINAGDLAAAESDLEAASGAAESDPALWVAVGRQRCRALLKAARWDEAEAIAQSCAAVAQSLGAQEARFIALLDHAFSTFMRYDLPQTELLLQQARLIFPDLAETLWGGRLMTVLSAVYRGQGRLDEAIAARRESLRLYRFHKDPINAANALMDLNRYHFYLHGTPDDAAQAEAEQLCRELGERRLESLFLEQAAHLAVDAGRTAEAEATLRRFRAVSVGQVIEARREFTYFFLITLIRLQQGRHAEASEAAAAARGAAGGGDVPQFTLLGDIVSGLAAVFTGQRDEGRGFLQGAVDSARASGVQEIVYALCYLAVIEADDGHPDAAAAALDEATARLAEKAEPVQQLLLGLCAAWVHRRADPDAVAAALASVEAGSPPPVSTSVDLRLMAGRLQGLR